MSSVAVVDATKASRIFGLIHKHISRFGFRHESWDERRGQAKERKTSQENPSLLLVGPRVIGTSRWSVFPCFVYYQIIFLWPENASTEEEYWARRCWVWLSCWSSEFYSTHRSWKHQRLNTRGKLNTTWSMSKSLFKSPSINDSIFLCTCRFIQPYYDFPGLSSRCGDDVVLEWIRLVYISWREVSQLQALVWQMIYYHDDQLSLELFW